MNTQAKEAKHIVVHGRVQGVGFRYFVREAGTELELTGDVRNLPDGTVEIVAEGSAATLAKFIEQVEQGPALSRVARLDVADVPATGAYAAFLFEGR